MLKLEKARIVLMEQQEWTKLDLNSFPKLELLTDQDYKALKLVYKPLISAWES